jgi:hypothetical protein
MSQKRDMGQPYVCYWPERVFIKLKGQPLWLPLSFVTVFVAYAPTGSATLTLTGVSQL